MTTTGDAEVKLSERLEALAAAEPTDNAERDHNAPDAAACPAGRGVRPRLPRSPRQRDLGGCGMTRNNTAADAHPLDRWMIDGQTCWMTGESCETCGMPMATQGRVEWCTAGCESAASAAGDGE